MERLMDAIYKAMITYEMHTFDTPRVVYMSVSTYEELEKECFQHSAVICSGRVRQIFGMDIIENNKLNSCIVVGGVIRDLEEGEHNDKVQDKAGVY